MVVKINQEDYKKLLEYAAWGTAVKSFFGSGFILKKGNFEIKSLLEMQKYYNKADKGKYDTMY